MRWTKLELAKHHLVYTLLRLGLPLEGVPQENRYPLRFTFLADTPNAPVLTGHKDGVITMNIAEADDPERERRRTSLHEPFRTLLGHFRHEVGHYYWDRLIANSSFLAEFRKLFGDDSEDYASSLRRYYEEGPRSDWQEQSVSAYATAHPWEDWAEIWAHYMHIVDTLETAVNFGLTLHPAHLSAKTMVFDAKVITAPMADFEKVLSSWVPLTYALNSLNRGMGLHDLYPFVLSENAIRKLVFVHEVVRKTSLSRIESASHPS